MEFYEIFLIQTLRDFWVPLNLLRLNVTNKYLNEYLIGKIFGLRYAINLSDLTLCKNISVLRFRHPFCASKSDQKVSSIAVQFKSMCLGFVYIRMMKNFNFNYQKHNSSKASEAAGDTDVITFLRTRKKSQTLGLAFN